MITAANKAWNGSSELFLEPLLKHDANLLLKLSNCSNNTRFIKDKGKHGLFAIKILTDEHYS